MGQDLHNWTKSELLRRGQEALKILRQIRSDGWTVYGRTVVEIANLLSEEERELERKE